MIGFLHHGHVWIDKISHQKYIHIDIIHRVSDTNNTLLAHGKSVRGTVLLTCVGSRSPEGRYPESYALRVRQAGEMWSLTRKRVH